MDFFNLISKAKAQGADTVSLPTFPFTPPGGSTPVTPATDKKIINVETDSTAVKVGADFRVRIKVETKDTKVSSFHVNISFDPNYLRVVDSDIAQSGIQVDFVDTVFKEELNNVNNTTGIITVKGNIEADNATALSRTVAEIEFVAVKAGKSELKIIQDNSSLINTSGVDVLDEVNSINFNISTQTVIIDPADDDTPPVIIPNTGIPDYFGVIIGSLAGIILIISGIYIKRLPKK